MINEANSARSSPLPFSLPDAQPQQENKKISNGRSFINFTKTESKFDSPAQLFSYLINKISSFVKKVFNKTFGQPYESKTSKAFPVRNAKVVRASSEPVTQKIVQQTLSCKVVEVKPEISKETSKDLDLVKNHLRLCRDYMNKISNGDSLPKMHGSLNLLNVKDKGNGTFEFHIEYVHYNPNKPDKFSISAQQLHELANKIQNKLEGNEQVKIAEENLKAQEELQTKKAKIERVKLKLLLPERPNVSDLELINKHSNLIPKFINKLPEKHLLPNLHSSLSIGRIRDKGEGKFEVSASSVFINLNASKAEMDKDNFEISQTQLHALANLIAADQYALPADLKEINHGSKTSNDAKEILKDQPVGAAILRFSESAEDYFLCIKIKDNPIEFYEPKLIENSIKEIQDKYKIDNFLKP